MAVSRINNIIGNARIWDRVADSRIADQMELIFAFAATITDTYVLQAVINEVDEIQGGYRIIRTLLNVNSIPSFDAEEYLENLHRNSPELLENKNLKVVYLISHIENSVSIHTDESQNLIREELESISRENMSFRDFNRFTRLATMISGYNPDEGTRAIGMIEDYFSSINYDIEVIS